VGGRGAQATPRDLLELFAVVGDAAAGAAEGEGGSDDRRQSHELQRRRRFVERAHKPALGRSESDPLHRLAEELPVLGLGDRLLARTDELDVVPPEHARARERHCDVERCLPAHGGQQCIRLLLGDDPLDHVGRDRLDVGGVRELRIGHDGGGIRVHQDDPVALFPERLARLRAGIIELAGLPDHDRTGTDDQDGFDIGALGHLERFPVGWIVPLVLIAVCPGGPPFLLFRSQKTQNSRRFRRV
jgi:hypothetical protein